MIWVKCGAFNLFDINRQIDGRVDITLIGLIDKVYKTVGKFLTVRSRMNVWCECEYGVHANVANCVLIVF